MCEHASWQCFQLSIVWVRHKYWMARFVISFCFNDKHALLWHVAELVSEGKFNYQVYPCTHTYTQAHTYNFICISSIKLYKLLVNERERESEREREREREGWGDIKFIALFWDRAHRGPCSSYKPCNHNLYIGIIIFPHISNPQSTGYINLKKTIKMINEKSEVPIDLTNHWRKRLWISLHVDLKRLN